MTPSTEMTMRPDDPKVQQTMHLFDGEAAKEKTFCGADAYACDLTSAQFCLRRLIDGIPVGNICLTCMICAACWAEGHCRRLVADATMLRARAQRLHEKDARRYRNSVEEAELEADLLLEQAREYGRLADTLSREIGLGRPSGDWSGWQAQSSYVGAFCICRRGSAGAPLGCERLQWSLGGLPLHGHVCRASHAFQATRR